MSPMGHFRPSQPVCLPDHVRFAPRADLKLGPDSIEIRHNRVIKTPEQGVSNHAL
jgi:hypothetical protein